MGNLSETRSVVVYCVIFSCLLLGCGRDDVTSEPQEIYISGPPNSTVQSSLSFRNTTGLHFEVSRIESSCSCVFPEKESLIGRILKPGDELAVGINLQVGAGLRRERILLRSKTGELLAGKVVLFGRPLSGISSPSLVELNSGEESLRGSFDVLVTSLDADLSVADSYPHGMEIKIVSVERSVAEKQFRLSRFRVEASISSFDAKQMKIFYVDMVTSEGIEKRVRFFR